MRNTKSDELCASAQGELASACKFWITKREAAGLLGISLRTLDYWVSARLIKSYKRKETNTVRFKREEVLAFYEKEARPCL